MRMKDTKRLPNSVITNEHVILKGNPKALLLHLFLRANIPINMHKMCKCTYKDILEALDITIDRNYKKKAQKLLNVLVEASYIDYRVNADDILEIEVLINQNPKGDFTRFPYSVGNNKDIPTNLLPTYVAILHHDFNRGYCNPSVSTLAKYSGCSINTCKKYIKKLEELNLTQVSISKGGSKKDTNIYYTSTGANYLYELIEVENTRFEYKKKKPIIKKKTPKVKEIIQKQRQEQKELLEEAW